MNKLLWSIVIVMLWGCTLWMCFWLGFLKSQMIANKVHHLDDARLLADQKTLLMKINDGEISKAQQNLRERIAIGESMAQMHYVNNLKITDIVLYAIYPREAMSLIRVSNLEEKNSSSH